MSTYLLLHLLLILYSSALELKYETVSTHRQEIVPLFFVHVRLMFHIRQELNPYSCIYLSRYNRQLTLTPLVSLVFLYFNILPPSFTNKRLRQFYVSDNRPTPQFQTQHQRVDL
ncbi:hypothetical protein ALC53_07869 [Atta colombica]|uniref:Secreted protein n=1 Tax=Atta colombica TaxID=520822 RepID=A0A195BAY2_9HYME|nr:hypothetical protein ALC53_07869 [Atta colombica]